MNNADRASRRRVWWLRWSGPGNALLTVVWLIMFLAVATVTYALTTTRAVTPQAITPTNEWVNFYSSRSYLHGQLVPVGAVDPTQGTNQSVVIVASDDPPSVWRIPASSARCTGKCRQDATAR